MINGTIVAAAELKDVAAFGQVAATLVIGLSLGYVAYQQWKTARDKFRFDLYDKRFRAYEAVLDFMNSVAFGDPTQKEVVSFDLTCREAFFLFRGDQKLLDFLALLRRKGEGCNALHAQAKGIQGPPNPQRTELVRQMQQVKDWFISQRDTARDHFARHISFR